MKTYKQLKQEILETNVKERMKNAYQKNKRKKKINKLASIDSHWKGLQ